MIPDRLRIAHILKSATQLSGIVSHPKEEALSLQANRDSLCYNFILIGEASAAISDEFKAAHPELPWAVMKQMRNILVHDYVRTDVDQLWLVVENDLDDLAAKMTAAKESASLSPTH